MSSLLNLAYQGAAPTQSPTRLMCIILGPVLHQDVAYHIFWKRETCCTAKLVLAWRLALYCSYVVSTDHWHCSRFLAIVLPSQGTITCNVIKDNSNNIVYCEFHCTTNNMSASIFLCHFQISNAISQQHITSVKVSWSIPAGWHFIRHCREIPEAERIFHPCAMGTCGQFWFNSGFLWCVLHSCFLAAGNLGLILFEQMEAGEAVRCEAYFSVAWRFVKVMRARDKCWSLSVLWHKTLWALYMT